MARSLKRTFGFAAFGAPFVLVVALSACGDDDTATPSTLVEIKPSSFVTTPPTAAGATTAASGSVEDGAATAEQSYEVQGGDNLFAIASDFEVEAEEIANFNNWSEGINHPLFPGDTVRIPPGAAIPSEDDDEDEDESESTDEGSDEESDTTEESEDPELCPDGSRKGSYTIAEGDIPGNVARQLDVSLDELNEANSNTPGYGGFIVGIEIVVPCGGDADATETTE